MAMTANEMGSNRISNGVGILLFFENDFDL